MKIYNLNLFKSLFLFIFCSALLLNTSVTAQIQNGDDQGVLPSKLYDTRSISMANTTISDVLGRPSIGINAAVSGLLNNPMILQFNTHHNWENNFMQHDLSLPTLSIGSHHFTARLGMLHRGFENLPFTTPSTLPDPDIISYRAEIAYAIAISTHFSLGTLQSVSYATSNNNEEAQYWNYFADLGLIYAPDGAVSYGLVFRGLGHETTYEIIETGQTTFGSQLARQSLEIGATLRYPIEESAYLSISFSNEKRFGEDGLWYKGGVEIIPISFIDIRGGIMVNFDQSLFIPRTGIGINAGQFQLDYMISPKNLDGEQFHQFGLTIQF